MRHLILTLSLLLGLTTSVSANNKSFEAGDVFFCQTEAYTDWDWEEKKLKNYKLEKFKFSISDEDTIKFGSSGFLANEEFPITFIENKMLYAARTFEALGHTTYTISLDRNNFSFTKNDYVAPSLGAATCDRF